MNFLYVFLGGGAGSLTRYLVGSAVLKNFSTNFPVATLCVNLVGCLIIGLLTGFAQRSEFFTLNTRLLLITGFLGGFTTFSAFGLETVTLIKRGDTALAFANIALSVGLGLAAVWIGLKVAE